MKLRLVISGGQTGADRTALECAKALGLETGGTVPKGCRTDEGNQMDLVTEFGCTESTSTDYRPRTLDNVRNADATVWIGRLGSPGYWCTRNAAKRFEKPFYENPTSLMFEYICNTYEVVNFAGNRRRINPMVVQMVRNTFEPLVALLRPPVCEDGPKAC